MSSGPTPEEKTRAAIKFATVYNAAFPDKDYLAPADIRLGTIRKDSHVLARISFRDKIDVKWSKWRRVGPEKKLALILHEYAHIASRRKVKRGVSSHGPDFWEAYADLYWKAHDDADSIEEKFGRDFNWEDVAVHIAYNPNSNMVDGRVETAEERREKMRKLLELTDSPLASYDIRVTSPSAGIGTSSPEGAYFVDSSRVSGASSVSMEEMEEVLRSSPSESELVVAEKDGGREVYIAPPVVEKRDGGELHVVDRRVSAALGKRSGDFVNVLLPEADRHQSIVRRFVEEQGLDSQADIAKEAAERLCSSDDCSIGVLESFDDAEFPVRGSLSVQRVSYRVHGVLAHARSEGVEFSYSDLVR